jgi:2-dehydro-3-deoxyphosphooctonate aldolase (KDO 8-P synthase)
MTEQKHIKAGNTTFGNDLPFTLIAGPCQMESRDHALMMAEKLAEITSKLGIDFIYKSSFDKANRTSLNSTRGIGIDKALPIFEEVKKTFGCPTLTDVHTEEQCAAMGDAIDILQIPAFLCRQTDLLIAAAKTGKVINIKKGQFLAPWDMKNVAAKVSDSGNDNIILTDRGTSFGYNTLVSDMRGLATMSETGYPVVIDATHSIQQPGGQDGTSGGQRHFVPVISRAAIAVGVAGAFMEVHQDPANAPSDGPCMVILDELHDILKKLVEIDAVVKKQP